MSSPVPIFGTQNLHDDDGQVIDSLVQAVNAPPELKDIVEPVPPMPDTKPPRPTRIITGTLTLTPAASGGVITQPVLILPSDNNRKYVHIDVYSFAVTPTGPEQYVYMADDPGKLGGSVMSAARLRAGKNFDDVTHRGPVYVAINPNAVDTVEVTWWAVTE